MKTLNTPLGRLPNNVAARPDATANALALYLEHARQYAADPDATGDIEHWAAGRKRHEADLGRWADESGNPDRQGRGRPGHGDFLMAAANREAEAAYLSDLRRLAVAPLRERGLSLRERGL